MLLAQILVSVVVFALQALASVPGGYFKSYHKLQDVNHFLETLSSTYPQNSKMFKVGTSYNSRAINGGILLKNVLVSSWF